MKILIPTLLSYVVTGLGLNTVPQTLFKMSRPTTIPQAALLSFSGAAVAGAHLSDFVKHDFVIATTLTAFTCANSMIVNDFFDAKRGTDSASKNEIVAGTVTESQVENYLFVSYALLAVGICTLYETQIALCLLATQVITIAYTPFFKPSPFVKNLVVAGIVGAAPLVGGLAAQGDLAFDSQLPEMCVGIFCIILHKEILMDVVDLKDDLNSGIYTIPFICGKETAVDVSFALLVAAATMTESPWTAMGPLYMMYQVKRARDSINTSEETPTLEDVLDSFKYSSAATIVSYVYNAIF